MADEQNQAASQPQPQQAAPQPAPVVRPSAPSPAPQESNDDKRARAAALRREAAEIEAGLGGPATVNVKVEPPHSAIMFGGMVVGNDFVPVPTARLADLEQAAANAGAKLTTEG